MPDDMHSADGHPHPFEVAPISEEIWRLKYQLTVDGGPSGQCPDASISDTWERLARVMASVETGGRAVRERWRKTFLDAVADFGFLPAGRIIAGAGAKARKVTLFNCFVMADLEDDLSAIFNGVRDAALTMQQGGGIGQDFSTLRPRGAMVHSVGAEASGPVSFMDVWDAMCRTLMSAGARRGAMMATLRCDHPDIEEFVAAKSDASRLRNFNLSVLVTDAFIAAVRKDADWPLVFGGKVYRTVSARALWERIMRATYDYAEPGVIFIDRINAENNLAYCEAIHATNPCGEQPLPPNGACLLGSINLARLVSHPFAPNAAIDTARLEERVRAAVRFLDNAIDASRMPLPAQKKEAQAKRRIGLGVTGLADALIFCGLRYGSEAACRQATAWMRTIQNAAYAESAELAAEKGPFPLYDSVKLLSRPGPQRLDPEVRALVARHGLRNGCLTSIAPTGTISLLAGNVSSGVEPVFALSYRRGVRDQSGTVHEQRIEDYAVTLFRSRYGTDAPLPDTFVTTAAIRPGEHLAMQAAVQPYVDSSISKTINCTADIPFDTFKDIYLEAYDMGLKGCTTFRPNEVTGAVLSADAEEQEAISSNPASEVICQDLPIEREPALAGLTYKLKWPGSDHAIYVTINDIEYEGRRRPFEIFINTKNLEHYAWTVALTRMISAVFRRGGDVSFVVEELKAVFDPQGGQWMQGHYVPSLLAAIGEIIEGHMVRTGFLPASAELRRSRSLSHSSPVTAPIEAGFADPPPPGRGRGCTRCGRREVYRHEGCWVCHACGYSRC
ncbi:MAG: hypothetical protein RLZ98_1176 [Pseudomonadota bacterium]|jgi:ribonucleoside-diphosphate reductase alpha chain